MCSKYKGGTNVFEMCITAQCVNAGSLLNLAVLNMTQHSLNTAFVREIIGHVKDMGVKPSLFLLDREFYFTDVIRTLDSMDVRYLIPRVNTDPVKTALERTRSGLRSDFEPDSHRLIPHGATFLARKLLILSAIIA